MHQVTDQIPDPTPGNYYISVKNGDKVGLVAGPFKTHIEALDMLHTASAKACEIDPWADFYDFGTIKTVDTYTKPGALNVLLGIQ